MKTVWKPDSRTAVIHRNDCADLDKAIHVYPTRVYPGTPKTGRVEWCAHCIHPRDQRRRDTPKNSQPLGVPVSPDREFSRELLITDREFSRDEKNPMTRIPEHVLVRSVRRPLRPIEKEEGRACAGLHQNVFFPKTARGAEQAIDVCSTCPVQGGCLYEALSRPEPYGVWGGATERQRKIILRKHPALVRPLRSP